MRRPQPAVPLSAQTAAAALQLRRLHKLLHAAAAAAAGLQQAAALAAVALVGSPRYIAWEARAALSLCAHRSEVAAASRSAKAEAVPS